MRGCCIVSEASQADVLRDELPNFWNPRRVDHRVCQRLEHDVDQRDDRHHIQQEGLISKYSQISWDFLNLAETSSLLQFF